MENVQGFDMKAYLEKRMMEITDLDERRLFKKIVGDILLSLYEYNRKAYERLEERILEERGFSQEKYAVCMTMTEKKLYDATDTFMHPMRPADIRNTKINCQEIRETLAKNKEMKLYTVFFQGSASQIRELACQKERIFRGTIKTGSGKYQASFALRRNQEYMDMVESLYDVFGANCQPWFTVCTAYLAKMLDVYLCGAEEMKGKEEVLEARADFEEYDGCIRYDMVPLWNLETLTVKTGSYPEPCIDKVNYEHQIFSRSLHPECEYLVQNTDMEITNIRRIGGDLFITSPKNVPCEWRLYQVSSEPGKENYLYPVLSNRYKESFSGSITEMFKKSIKTKGEMARLIESFDYREYVTFLGFHICENVPMECMAGNYNMDGFLQDEIRTGVSGEVLVVDFEAKDPACYLNEDIMSFLVTQIQKIFPEYHCVGRLAEGGGT